MAHAQPRNRGDSLLDAESENPPKRRRQEEEEEEEPAAAAAASTLAEIHALSDMSSSTDVKSDPAKMYVTLDLIRARLDAFEQAHRSSDDESKAANSSSMMIMAESPTTTLSLPSNDQTMPRDEDEGKVLSPLFPIPLVGPPVLQMAMAVPELIHHGRQVCSTWRHFVRPDNQHFWKDVAMNQYSSVLPVIMSGMTAEEKKHFDFYNFVAGMSQKPNLPPPEPGRMEDLVLVIELYQTMDDETEVRKKVGTFCCTDCSSWLRGGDEYYVCLRLEQDSDDPLILDFLNPLSSKAESLAKKDQFLAFYRQRWRNFHEFRRAGIAQNDQASSMSSPLAYAAERHKFSVRAVLFRRDDWRSVCLAHAHDDRSPIIEVAGGCYRYDFYDESFPSFAPDQYGAATRRLFTTDSGDTEGFCYISLQLDPVMPARGSPSEVKWQKELRKENVHDMDWNESEEAEIAAISHFQFRITSISVGLSGEVSELRRMVETDDELVRALEGLNWNKYS